jgi:hypothetical protein
MHDEPTPERSDMEVSSPTFPPLKIIDHGRSTCEIVSWGAKSGRCATRAPGQHDAPPGLLR